MLRDQDLLFGPAEAAAIASSVAERETARKRLSEVQAILEREREQHKTSEAAWLSQIADEERRRDEALKAVNEAQAEVQALKNEAAGESLLLSSCFFVMLFCLVS